VGRGHPEANPNRASNRFEKNTRAFGYEPKGFVAFPTNGFRRKTLGFCAVFLSTLPLGKIAKTDTTFFYYGSPRTKDQRAVPNLIGLKKELAPRARFELANPSVNQGRKSSLRPVLGWVEDSVINTSALFQVRYRLDPSVRIYEYLDRQETQVPVLFIVYPRQPQDPGVGTSNQGPIYPIGEEPGEPAQRQDARAGLDGAVRSSASPNRTVHIEQGVEIINVRGQIFGPRKQRTRDKITSVRSRRSCRANHGRDSSLL